MSPIIMPRTQLTSNAAAKTEDRFVGLHPIVKSILTVRGITCEGQLEHSLKRLTPYQQLKDIDKAVARLVTALQQQQKILVIGDFDADGATSTAIAVRSLKALGAKHIDFLVPNRFEFGYGLTPEIVDVAQQNSPNLIITVDNGISSCEGVARANDYGIDVIVTDHHLPAEQLPQAVAIVNPNQPGDEFPSKNLAGVGVIFYTMLALRNALRQINWFENQGIAQPNLANYLDIVALGTVADVVPLDFNNRILVHQGLQRIRSGQCCAGIQALLEISNRNYQRVVSSDLGFALGPRLNAAGRLDDMSIGIQCLLTDDITQARTYAQQLNELNNERRNIEADMQQQAFTALKKLALKDDTANLPFGLCLYDEQWHQGVIGILASRIKDHFHRPVIAFAPGDEQLIKGSARSVKGLHIRDILQAIDAEHPGLILKFGGHAMAAGLTLAKGNFEKFRSLFALEVAKHLSEADLKGVIYCDGTLSPADFNLELAHYLRSAMPWGQEFPEPVFHGEFNVIEQRIVASKHLKLIVQAVDGQEILDGIHFNADLNQWPNQRVQQIKLAYRLDVNEYAGRSKLQLLIEYLEAL